MIKPIRLLIFIPLVLSGVVHAEIDWNGKNIKWHGYADGLMEAKKQGKNVVLIVYTEWCPVCKKYSKMFFDKAVVENSNNVILVRLDQDKDTRYIKKFSLDGAYVPRTYILDSNFNILPSPFKSKKYDHYLAPGNADYLVSLFKWLRK